MWTDSKEELKITFSLPASAGLAHLSPWSSALLCSPGLPHSSVANYVISKRATIFSEKMVMCLFKFNGSKHLRKALSEPRRQADLGPSQLCAIGRVEGCWPRAKLVLGAHLEARCPLLREPPSTHLSSGLTQNKIIRNSGEFPGNAMCVALNSLIHDLC